MGELGRKLSKTNVFLSFARNSSHANGAERKATDESPRLGLK